MSESFENMQLVLMSSLKMGVFNGPFLQVLRPFSTWEFTEETLWQQLLPQISSNSLEIWQVILSLYEHAYVIWNF